MALEAGDLIAVAAALVLTALAVFLLARKGRNAVTASMATFALGLAGLYVVRAAFAAIGPSDLRLVIFVPYATIVAGILGLAWFVERDHGRLSTRQRWSVWSLAAVVSFVPLFATHDAYAADAFATPGARRLFLAGEALGNVGYYGAALAMAQRGLARDMPHRGARSLALLAVGLTLYAAGTAALWVGEFARSTLFAIPYLIAGIAMGVFWLRPGSHPRQRLGIVTGLTILAVWTLATLAEQRFPGTAFPIGRVLGTGLMVYAVLHGEIAGIDAKVRFTLSKTSVAAVFVGVFFAASELAQQFFGERFQSEYLGIAAAGLLVVAIAPLQRLADRLAARAIPTTLPATSKPEQVYREQVETAWTDGRISANEKVMLRKLRASLGVSAETAEAIEHEVESRAAQRKEDDA